MLVADKYTKEQVSNYIRDYHWMIKEVKRITGNLNDTEFRGVAQYGIEATLPKPQGSKVDQIANEVARREINHKQAQKYLKRIMFIQDNMHKVKNDRHKAVLDCLLEGLSVTKVSYHMGVSRKHVHSIKDDVAEILLK